MSDRFSLSMLEHPIVQAPMGGGPSTPALAAAVCEAGGLVPARAAEARSLQRSTRSWEGFGA